MRVLDSLILSILMLIGVLVLSGGVKTAQWEMSQIDAWGWVVLLLGSLRWKLTGTAWPQLPKSLTSFINECKKSPSVLALVKVVNERPAIFVLSAMAGHVLFYVVLCIFRYVSFDYNAYDLGFIDQALWSTVHLKWPEGILHSSLSKGHIYLGEHFSPLLILLAPLYALVPSVWWLFLVQSILLASGAWFVYRLCQKQGLAPIVTLSLVACYFLYQPLRAANIFSFREDLFFVPLFFAGLSVVDVESPSRRQRMVLWVSVGLSFLVKENAPLVTFVFGLWLCMRRRLLEGFILCGLSLFLFSIINNEVVPYFSTARNNTVLVTRLGALGSNSGEIFLNLLLHPLRSATIIFGPLLNRVTLKYLVLLWLPFLLPMIALFKIRGSQQRAVHKNLSLMFPVMIAGALTLMNLMITQRTVGYHYECILIPFLFAFLIAGFPAVIRAFGQSTSCAVVIILFLCVYGRSPVLSFREWFPNSINRCLMQALDALPSDARIATITSLQPHLDHRRDAGILTQVDFLPYDLIVSSRREGLSQYSTTMLSSLLQRLEDMAKQNSASEFEMVINEPLIQVFCRRSYCAESLKSSQWINSLKQINQSCSTL